MTVFQKPVKLIGELYGKLIGSTPIGEDTPLLQSEYDELYKPEKSFVQYLPFVDFDDDLFLFDDDITVASFIDLHPADVDGRPADVLVHLEKALTRALGRIPEKTENPWVLQVYQQDEPIQSLINDLTKYAKPSARKSKLFSVWIKELEEHIQHLSNPEGLFVDEGAGIKWRG